VPPCTGTDIARGNAQSAFGGGSIAGGRTEVFAGGVGVIAQLATFEGSPWHPLQTNVAKKIIPTRIKAHRVELIAPERCFCLRSPTCIPNPQCPSLRREALVVEDQHRGAAQNAITTGSVSPFHVLNAIQNALFFGSGTEMMPCKFWLS
jgi:hypothetical protein